MDYYEVLGVSRDADTPEIKKAYRQLARQCHPDVNGGSPEATERFKRISEAYAVLSDPQKRRQYDSGGAVEFGFDGGLDFIMEMFNNAVGFGGGRYRGRRAGRDREISVSITLDEVLTGAEREVSYERIGLCDTCDGHGAAPGSRPTTCPTCHGHGQVRQRQDTILGSMVTIAPCPQCGGAGSVIDNPCPECDGVGAMRNDEELTVQVPPGIQDGQHLEYVGMGDLSPEGGRPGNLYVRVRVAEHDVFTRHGSDLHMSLEIGFPQAALGDTVTVPTLEGSHELQIPAGIQPGEEIRLRGKGLPTLRGARRGDQVVSIRVQTPTDLSDRQVQLLHDMAVEEGIELNPPDGSSIFDRVRKAFSRE